MTEGGGPNPGAVMPPAAEDDGPVSAQHRGGVPDAGVLRNTLLQFATQVAGVVFTGALTLYLVRALGASGYGLYALAVSIAGLLVLPAGLGLPLAVGRFLADHRHDLHQVRAILGLGMRFQVPAGLIASVGLFAAAGPVADAYGHPGLGWPLRWAALSIAARALFSFLTSVGTSVRQAGIGLWMAISESAVETVASVALVLAGAGAAGAVLGRTIGYIIGCAAGAYLTLRLLRRPASTADMRPRVTRRTLVRYAGAMFLVDLSYTALAQLDVLLIGALLSAAAVGKFSAIWRILVVLGYVGVAVSGGVAPRLSLGSGAPDTEAFGRSIRYLMIIQGLAVAPLLVWAKPIVELLFGPSYGSAASVLRVLTVVAFVSPPAALISASVTYLGEARRRIVVVLATLVLGFVSIYGLVKATGLVGAAIGDDIVVVVYVATHLWICTRLITVDLRMLAWSCVRTLVAAGAMAAPLWAMGVDHLSAARWVSGLVSGSLAYMAVLLATRELSIGELRMVVAKLGTQFARLSR